MDREGLIPKGVSLLLQVMSPCRSLLGGVNIGPALNDQDLGTVMINVEAADITLTGKAVDCSGSPGVEWQLYATGASLFQFPRCFHPDGGGSGRIPDCDGHSYCQYRYG